MYLAFRPGISSSVDDMAWRMAKDAEISTPNSSIGVAGFLHDTMNDTFTIRLEIDWVATYKITYPVIGYTDDMRIFIDCNQKVVEQEGGSPLDMKAAAAKAADSAL